MSDYLPFCNLLWSRGRIILLCFDWSVYSIFPGEFLPISLLVNLESPVCRIGLHQTILSSGRGNHQRGNNRDNRNEDNDRRNQLTG